MAVTEDIEKQVLAEASEATPNFSVDYNDPRLSNIKAEEQQQLTEDEQIYGGMIDSTDKYYNDLKQEAQDWADKQTALQQEQTDFAIDKIEQQKDQAAQDYRKEQSASYVDWQKQSNPYGVNAEKMASAGLTNTGYSESSQVSMYNTYQNRVATARESYNRAVLNYDNAIKDAILQNNATLAEIAHTALQQQLELSLQGFQYKNSLITELSDKKLQTKQFYANQWQNTLNQINTENALKWDVTKYYDDQKWNTEQRQLDRDFQSSENEKQRDWESNEAEIERAYKSKEAELDRKFKENQAALDRKHDKEMLAAETAAEKEKLAIEHKNAMAKLAQEHKNDLAILEKEKQNELAVISYKNSSSNSTTSGVKQSLINKGVISSGNTQPIKKKSETVMPFDNYDDAIAYMKKMGVPSEYRAGLMTISEWSRRRTSYTMTGIGGAEVKNNSSYKEYASDYVKYCISSYT